MKKVTVESLSVKIAEAIAKLNVDSQQEKLKERDVKSVKDDIKDLNKVARSEQFNQMKNLEDPLKAAIMALTFTQYKLSDKTDKDTDLRSFELAEFQKRIPLLDFVSFCSPKVIVADPTISCRVANFAMLLAARKADDLGLSEAEVNTLLSSYRLIKKATRVNTFDREKTLTSNNTMKTELQALVDGYITGLQVESSDVNFMCDLFTKQGKESLSVELGTPAKMADIMVQVLHRLLAKKAYKVNYKSINK